MLQIMEELSFRVSVPPEHVSDGRVMERSPQSGTRLASHRLFDVHYCADKPEDALAAIQSRGYWFLVDDRDYRTKRILALLMIMLNLAESDEKGKGPVVTIGTGL